MASAKFLYKDTLKKVQFFEVIFLLANISMEMVLKILFLSYTNADVEFAKQLGTLTWKLYIATEVLPITSRVEFIDKKEFAKIAMDVNPETFIVYFVALEAMSMSIHLFWAAQLATL